MPDQSNKPWQRSVRPPRRTAPETLARDRPPQSRQPGETLAAYRGFLIYLRSGSIRAAADALSKNRTTFERWSRRWRWPERRQRVLAGVVRTQLDQLVFEMRYGLEAAEDSAELDARFWTAFREVGVPRINRELKQTLKELQEGR